MLASGLPEFVVSNVTRPSTIVSRLSILSLRLATRVASPVLPTRYSLEPLFSFTAIATLSVLPLSLVWIAFTRVVLRAELVKYALLAATFAASALSSSKPFTTATPF